VDTMTETRPDTRPLTAQDRCDGCPARAAVRLRMRSGLELTLCTHHYRKNASALVSQGAVIEEKSDG